jgi:spermidine synthase
LFNDFVPSDPNAVRPVVYEDERTVSMHFDISATQSSMRRADPHALELAYTRTMMGFVFVVPDPAAMLMIGLGGGSLPKYCSKHFPAADITVVEINPHVIAMRDAFFVPPDGPHFRVVCDDGAAFVARTDRRFDIVLVDGFSYEGQPASLCSAAFYAACRRVLSERGIVVVNLHEEEPDCSAYIERISHAFDGDVQVVAPESGGNRVVFAGRSAAFRSLASDFERRWLALPEVHRRTLRKSASRIVRSVRAASSAG